MRTSLQLAVILLLTLATSAWADTDHLDPMDPADREQQMIRHLLGVDESVGLCGPWMVAESGVNSLATKLPAEYAIVIRPKQRPPSDKSDGGKMILEVARLDHSVWLESLNRRSRSL
jgi:hypothetical protein